ncbi:erythromycin esterase family protein [Streptomyces sp. NPDC051976]|uniref:erythromycin esterase family protein n=1 Tax=Streptomyces sp. NPDC051976 TaxID=3154947 RepID=UPI003436B192
MTHASHAAAVRAVVGDARVVALGEGAHSVTEFYEQRHSLFRLLVEELGFTALVLESGFAEGLAVDAWVRGGDGDVEAVAREGVSYRFGECEPMRRQLGWLRATGGVRFYGMDLPGSSTSPGPAVRACLERLPAWPGDAELLRLSDLGGRSEAAVRSAWLPAADRQRLMDGLLALYGRALRDGDDTAVRCAESLRAFVADAAAGQLPARQPYPREEFMADTVRWILEREQRVLVSAHNAHVRRTPLHGRPMLGALLAAELGPELKVIGMTYGSGPEVRITPRSPRPFDWEVSLRERELAPESLEARLERLPGGPELLVDTRQVPPGFFDGVTGTQVGGGLDPLDDVPAAFDALLHVRHVTRVPGAFERLRDELEAAARLGTESP